MAERCRLEEKIGKPWVCDSLGLIDVLEKPILWVNVVACTSINRNGIHETGYRVVCGIPDPNLTHTFPKTRIEPALKKNFPLFGEVVDVRWKG